MGSATTRPAARYGDDRAAVRRRRLLPLGAVAAALALAWVVWAGLGAAERDVRWTDVGYELADDQVRVTFDVIAEPGTATACEVAALDGGYATVGLLRVDLPPADQRVVRHRIDVPTAQRAVTGVVRTCRAR